MNYENRVVVFIDILGFGGLVKRTVDVAGNDNADKIDALNQLLLLARDVLDIDKPEDQFCESKKITQFSDSIVISFLATEESEVFHTLLGILHLIMAFIYKGTIIRGGIAYGKLIHDEKIIFGPAMIQAYETEQKAALYPRVILDESIIKIGIKHGYNPPKYEKEALLNIVSKDTDDMYYIDYFKNAQSELDDPEYDMPTYIEKLRDIIEPNMLNQKADIKAKYGWMKNKFNKLVRNYKNAEFIEHFKKQGEEELVDYYTDLKEV